jgi:hypothetical protein
VDRRRETVITRVEVDDTDLLRALAQFGRGIESQVDRVGFGQASTTAADIRERVPVRSGRLAATVRPVRDAQGGAVTYGGALPYARYIERRTGAVAAAVAAGTARFPRDCEAAAETEARRI